MTADIPNLEKYRKEFEKHMSEVDEITQLILKGHLVIESVLDNIITLIFFHPENLREARLGFAQKVCIARAQCLRKSTLSMWDVVLKINELRNAIAHNLTGKLREEKIKQLRQLCADESTPKIAEKASDIEIVVHMCALSLGFLANYEHDLGKLREYIDAVDATLNPESERVRPRHG